MSSQEDNLYLIDTFFLFSYPLKDYYPSKMIEDKSPKKVFLVFPI